MFFLDGLCTSGFFRYTQGKQFSVEALQIAIGYFLEIGHKVTAFVPQFRVEKGESTNPELLQYLVDLKLVILTPSKRIGSQRVTPYDDRCVFRLNAEKSNEDLLI